MPASPLPPPHEEPLEVAAPGDPYRDYCLFDYAPPTAGGAAALRSSAVLRRSFELCGVEAIGETLIAGLRAALGLHATVWGIKRGADGAIASWELYFYEWGGEATTREQIVRVVADLATPARARVDRWRALPWHMVSLEVGPDGEMLKVLGVDVYVGSRSYRVEADGLELRNLYSFHRPAEDVADMLERIELCPHYDRATMHSGDVLPFDLWDCYRICVANKRAADAVYFQRVSVRQLVGFMRRHAWPDGLTDFIADHASRLEHLLWDVGADFGAPTGGGRFTKTGIYGIV